MDPSGNRHIESADNAREKLAPQTPEAAAKQKKTDFYKNASNVATTVGIVASTVAVGIAFVPAAGALAIIGTAAGAIELLSGGFGLVTEFILWRSGESSMNDVLIGSGAIAAGRLGTKAAGLQPKFLPKVDEVYRGLDKGLPSVIDSGIGLGLGIRDLD